MFTFWLAGAGRVRGSRFFFILLGVAVVGILAVIFFGADSNKRGMPPQANLEAPPSVPPPTPAPAPGDRKSVVSGTSVSVRVDPGGRRNLQNQNRLHQTKHSH